MKDRDITRGNVIVIITHYIRTRDNEFLAHLLSQIPECEEFNWNVYDYIPDDTDSGDNRVIRGLDETLP